MRGNGNWGGWVLALGVTPEAFDGFDPNAYAPLAQAGAPMTIIVTCIP